MQNDAFWQNPVLQKAFQSRFFFVFFNKNNFMLRIAENGFIAIRPYLIIVIFFTLTQFLENKIYTEKRQFFALNL